MKPLLKNNIRQSIRLFRLMLFVALLVWGFSVRAQISAGGSPMPLEPLKSLRVEKQLVLMPAFELHEEALNPPDLTPWKSIKYAHSFEVKLTPENSGMMMEQEGYRIWQLLIKSEGAKSLNVIFTKFHLPEGARLFLSDPSQEKVLGAFTAANNKPFKKLATYPVAGETLLIQYEEPLDAAFEAELEIGKVNHDYLGIVPPYKNRWTRRISGPCNVDINCEPSYGMQLQQRAVCRILSDDELGTATLLNNSSENGKPYLISAYHIFDKPANAELTLFDFNYESPYCSEIDGYDLQSVSGATAVAWFDSLDFMLVELSRVPPANYRPYYTGWNASGEVPQFSRSIHHPNGDTKKISTDEGVCDSISFSRYLIKNGHWKVGNWEEGTTEAGSSGAGLFNRKQQLTGTLSGGYASCTNLSYDAFGRFDKMWNYRKEKEHQLKYWLDPFNTGILELNGYDPYSSGDEGCTLISNFLIEDELINSENMLVVRESEAVAELFGQLDEAWLSGISLGIHSYAAHSVNPQFEISVYTGNELPGVLVKSYVFQMNELTLKAMNYFDLGETLHLKGNFFVSIHPVSPKDSLYFYHSSYRNLPSNASLFLLREGIWEMASENEEGGASLLMEATVCGATFVNSVDTIDDHQQGFIVYPNPASGNVTLAFNEIAADQQVKIYDRTGRLLYHEVYGGRHYASIDLRGFHPGIYLVQLISDGIPSTQKLLFTGNY